MGRSSTESELDVRGERFHVLRAGAGGGPPALLLHGFPDLPATWSAVMARLADAGFDVVAPRRRGYAPSPTRGRFDARSLAGDVFAIAEAAFGDRPFHLVGHDWGAAIAHVASRLDPSRLDPSRLDPSRLSTVTAISVPHPHAYLRQLAADPGQLRRSLYQAFFQLPALPERALPELVPRLWSRWSPGLVPPPGHLADVAATLRASSAPLTWYRAAPRSLFAPWIARATAVPTQYLHGADDGCLAPGADQRRYHAGPYEERVLEGVGHFVPLEAPDVVASSVAAWAGRHG